MTYRIGVLGAADIAYRMFMPALKKNAAFVCAGIAANAVDGEERKERFRQEFGITVYDDINSYDTMIMDPSINALYIPLPPALHYAWARKALLQGKRLLEKPSTDCYAHTRALTDLARKKGLALQENYMFQYHSQIRQIQECMRSGTLGELRLIRGNFCFPMRAANDFRYNKALGGGGLLDACGYVVKLATILLGKDIRITDAVSYMPDGFEVDMYGAFTAQGNGLVFQGAYGMDNFYQCSLELLGSKAKLTAERIFTAPPGLCPPISIETPEGRTKLTTLADAHFENSLAIFHAAMEDDGTVRSRLYDEMELQAKLIDEINRIIVGMKKESNRNP